MTYARHPQLADLDDPCTVLWRYVDMYRFLDLLQTTELHLTRADQMEDRWEGSYSAYNIAMRPTVYGEAWGDGFSDVMRQMYRHARSHTYLNCWYIGDVESYAMWKLYDAAGKGVAIKTTAERLHASLRGADRAEVHGSQVSYVDYAQTYIPEGNMFFPYIHKRLSFEHEREYRLLAAWSPKVLEIDENNTAIRSEPDDPPLFLREAVDLDRLIDSVFVSPDAPNWVANTVAEVTHRYLPEVPVIHSDLAADPVF